MKSPFITLSIADSQKPICININSIAYFCDEGPKITIRLLDGKEIIVLGKFRALVDTIDNYIDDSQQS